MLWADPILGGVETTICSFVHHRFAPHTHDTLMLGLIETGAKTFARGRANHVVAAGGISVVNPGEAHTGARAGEGVLRYRALYVSPDLFNQDDRTGIEVCAATIDDPLLFRELWAATEAIITGAPRLEREERLLSSLGTLRSRHSGRWHRPDAPIPDRVVWARELITQDLDQRMAIDDIANAVSLSPFHLMRSFREHFGLPMHAYQLGLQIDKARDQLRRGHAPLAQIALDCGFADQSHFSRRFKAKVGVTPAAYRRAFRPA